MAMKKARMMLVRCSCTDFGASVSAAKALALSE